MEAILIVSIVILAIGYNLWTQRQQLQRARMIPYQLLENADHTLKQKGYSFLEVPLQNPDVYPHTKVEVEADHCEYACIIVALMNTKTQEIYILGQFIGQSRIDIKMKFPSYQGYRLCIYSGEADDSAFIHCIEGVSARVQAIKYLPSR